MGLRDSKVWRYRYLLYVAAIAYYGYKAYQVHVNPQTAQVQVPEQDGSEVITLPDGQKARLYDVDAFMKLHGQTPKQKGQGRSPVELAPQEPAKPPQTAKTP